MYLTDQGMVFVLVRIKEGGSADARYKTGMERLVFSLTLMEVEKKPRLRGLDQTGAAFHFFKGDDPAMWTTHVPAFRKVLFEEVYSGIDMIISCTEKGVEYAFSVKPGSDPGLIKMAYEGVNGLWVDKGGGLVVDTPFGSLKETAPLAYQDGVRKQIGVSSRFRMAYVADRKCSFAHGFEMEGYDRDRSLTIDPTLIYSSFLGGSSKEYGWGVAVDGSGRSYVGGYTQSADFPTQNGYEPDYQGGDWDAFVTRFSADGSSVQYSSYLGGSLDDQGHGLAVDDQGCAYVTGYTRSTDFPTTPGAFDTSHNGGPDVFLTKLSADGNSLLYSTYLGGSTETVHGDNALDVAVDGSYCAYVTGRTFSTDFPFTTGAFQTAKNNGTATPDIFVTQFNAAGSALAYSTYVGGSATDYGYGIALDSSGYVYVGGWTDSEDFPTEVPFQEGNAGKADVVVFKINPAGAGADDMIYSTYLGGTEDDCGRDVAVDSSGSAYLTGYTCSNTFSTKAFPTQNAYQATFAGGVSDAFVTKMAADGRSLSYSTYLGGADDDAPETEIPESGFGIALQGSNAYVAGWTNATDFPMENAYHDENAGLLDVFLTKMTTTGASLSYSTYLGGANDDIGLRIAVDSGGNAFATGYAGEGFPQVNPAQTSGFGGGVYDAFVLKYYGESATLVELASFTATPFENGIRLEWTTASELNAAGFHLLRSPTADGTYTRITDAMIPARGGSMWETRYTYEDFGPVPGHTCYYKLEDIDYDGHSAFHGPVSAWRGMVDIKVNGSDGPVVVLPDAPVSVFVDLSSGFHESQPTELWIVGATPFLPPLDWYSFTTVSGWQPGIHPWAQQPFNLSLPFEVFNGALSTGTYLLYVAVDDPDGVPADPWLGLDSVEVTVGE